MATNVPTETPTEQSDRVTTSASLEGEALRLVDEEREFIATLAGAPPTRSALTRILIVEAVRARRAKREQAAALSARNTVA